ncbi:MAG: class I SAM-dependent methyltransferase [Candidatus Krumholzibacteriia bacterium]
MTGRRWFADHYDEIFPFRPGTLAFLQRHLPEAGRLLDVGCGPGTYAARLAAAGREVLGIDIDGDMIARARREHPQAAYRQLDLRCLAELRGSFAGVYSLGNVMAFLAPSEWPAFLGDLANRLEPGGCWLFQTVNFDPLIGSERHAFPPLELPSGERVLREYVQPAGPAGETGAVRFRIHRQVGDARELVSEDVIHPHSSTDSRRRHEAAGFALAAHAGDFSGAPFDPPSSGASIQVWRRI